MTTPDSARQSHTTFYYRLRTAARVAFWSTFAAVVFAGMTIQL